jgi:hypothetical protein
MPGPTRHTRLLHCPEDPGHQNLSCSPITALTAFIVLLAVPLTSAAQLVTVDFSVGPIGSIGPTYTDPSTGLQALGMWCNGDESTCVSPSGVWSPANLWRRNDHNGVDLGFGVCDPAEGSACATGTATDPPGEFNELSDNIAPEIIYLKLPAGYQWVSVTLASLDDNSTDAGPPPERGILWADVDTTPNNGNATFVTDYSGTGNGPPFVITIPTGFTSSPYLFFEAFDFTGGGSTNNDQLVYQATLRATTPNCVVGPSSMEGAIKIKPGDWVSGGYSFTFPGSHAAITETISAEVDIPVTCPNGASGGTIRIPLGAPASCSNGACNPGTVTYTVPVNDSSWFPTGDANSVRSWQGAVLAPDLCSGSPMNASKGAVFSAVVGESPSGAPPAHFTFKYRDPNAKGKGNVDCADPNWSPISQRNDAATCGASWSATVNCPGR